MLHLGNGVGPKQGGALNTLIVFWGDSLCMGPHQPPVVGTGWDDPITSEVRWWQRTGSTFYAGAGTATATGTPDGAFVKDARYTSDELRVPADVGMARALLAKGSTDFAVVRVGMGSTGVFNYWQPGDPIVGLFEVLTFEVSQAISQLSWEPVLLLSVTTVGAQDATNSGQAAVYASKLQNIWGTFKDTFPDQTHQIVVWKIHPDLAGRPFWPTVADQQALFVAANTDAALLDNDAYPLLADDTHFSSLSTCQIGVDAMNLKFPTPHAAFDSLGNQTAP